jgi:hypothetical protein
MRADRVLKLSCRISPASWRAACRSSWGSGPPIGDASRISMESRSRPVRTRCRASTSPCPMSRPNRPVKRVGVGCERESIFTVPSAARRSARRCRRWQCGGGCGDRGSRGWCSRAGAWRGMRRGLRLVRRGSHGPSAVLLPGWGRRMRPAYWTSRPFCVTGAARKRVSSGCLAVSPRGRAQSLGNHDTPCAVNGSSHANNLFFKPTS